MLVYGAVSTDNKGIAIKVLTNFLLIKSLNCIDNQYIILTELNSNYILKL